MSTLEIDHHLDLRSRSRLRQSLFSAFAVALGLSVIFGFLNFLREPPSGDFYAEWAALLFFSCAAGFIVPVLPRRFGVDPSLLAVPAVLAAILGLQIALGRYEYFQNPIFWLGYLCLAALAVTVGQGIRAAGLEQEVTERLAWALLIAAVANSAAQVVQALQLESAFAPFVVRLTGKCAPYGNVGQPNHAATLAWLGLAGVLYLTGIGRLSSRLALPVISVLLIGAALTASRMAWLFLGLATTVILLLPAWPARNLGTRRLIAAMLVSGFVIATYGSGLVLAGISSGCASGFERMADRQEGGLLVRLELWQQAIEVWRMSPWLGVGAFNFLPTVYATEPAGVHRPFDTYSHNAFLQILAEFGLVGAGVLLAALLLLFKWLVAAKRELRPADAVLLVWLGTVAVHAMLEFPLWYSHFLIVFCLSLGLLIRPEWNARAVTAPARWPLLALAFAMLACAVFLFLDYRKLDRLYWLEDQRSAFSAAPTTEVLALVGGAADPIMLFRIQADHLLGLSEPINGDDLQRKIANTERLLAVSPQPIVSIRRIALAILDNDPETARIHLRRIFTYFPGHAEMMAGTLRRFVDRRPQEFAALGPLLTEELANAPQPRW